MLSGPAKRGSNIGTHELFDEQRRRERPAFENREVQGALREGGDNDGGEDERSDPGGKTKGATHEHRAFAQSGANIGDEQPGRTRPDVEDDQCPGIEQNRGGDLEG